MPVMPNGLWKRAYIILNNLANQKVNRYLYPSNNLKNNAVNSILKPLQWFVFTNLFFDKDDLKV